MTTAVVQATKSAGISELIDNSAQLNEEMSESDSSEPIQPVTSSDLDDSSHVYTNIREIEESNSRPIPPTPRPEDVPRRDMMNGWFEYETDVGRTFFYNRETGKSQWIPPRLIRTPAQVKVRF
uniref:WW domain-containing protein n=2 Tax=Caenorhabditis japonica TaxID=281687 RepID=A0A8R1IH79_CAEJA